MRKIEGIEFFTVAEIAKKLRLTERTVNRYLAIGRLKCRHIGRTPYISRDHLNEYLTGSDPARLVQAEKE